MKIFEIIQKKPTDSPEFKRWFGNSKVVDSNGQPLVVYHGTGGDFSEFRTDTEGMLGKGAYFTNRPEVASNYSTYGITGSPNVIPVYLSLQNPYITKKGVVVPSRTALEKQGFDGIIDTIGNNMEYVVFNPSQIKSAVGNTGSFDSHNTNFHL
jgi:hypothetical protein